MNLLKAEDQSQGIALTVAPEAGAEISSLRVLWKDEWVETLYRADLQDEPIDSWQGRGPWLWPAAGRSLTQDLVEERKRTGAELETGAYIVDGKRYPMPNHGFAMKRVWKDVSSDTTEIRCSLASDDETLTYYPFLFELETWFRIQDESVLVDFKVTSDSRNSTPMPFAIGNHITFELPLGSNVSMEQCELFCASTKELLITPEDMLDGSSRPLSLKSGRTLDDKSLHNNVLGGLTKHNAWASVWCPEGFGMEVRQSVVEGQSFAPGDDHWYFVLWGEADKRLYCPEPWIGGPNALNTGEGIISLPPGEIFTWQIKITPVLERPVTRQD